MMTQSIQNQTIQKLPSSAQQLPVHVAAVGLDPHQFVAMVSSSGGGAVQLTLRGDIDLAVRAQFRAIIETLFDGERLNALLIDMTAVTFLDCGGIGVLIAGRQLAVDAGGAYRVVNDSGIVARVLEMTGVRPFLDYSSALTDGSQLAART